MPRLPFQNKSYFFISQAGCLLPLFILFNLFFGWMLFKPFHWLAIEVILILLFVINSYIVTRKILSSPLKRDNAIDVEGKVVEDNKKLE